MPSALRGLRGGKESKATGLEPEAKVAAPSKPDWLDGYASGKWDELVPILLEMGVLTEADGTALQMACSAWSEWRQFDDLVHDGDGLMKGRSVRPEVRARGDAWRRWSAGAAEFGLTPAAKTRVRVQEKKAKDPFDELAGRGRGSRETA